MTETTGVIELGQSLSIKDVSEGAFATKLIQLTESAKHSCIAVDMHALEHIDSCAILWLIALQHQLSSTSIKFQNMPVKIRTMIALMGLTSFFNEHQLEASS